MSKRKSLLVALLGAAAMLAAQAAPVSDAAVLQRLAPDADPKVLAQAYSAVQCAQASGVGEQAQRLAVIDYSRSSREPRLWVFDLQQGKLLYREHVAHGQGTGADRAEHFSNRPGSLQSSLGLFLTADTYQGRNGYSLRMEGLEAGINDQAMARAIVMHGAPYVDPQGAQRMGRLGRSWGCPAVRVAVARPMIDHMKSGQFLFSYYPDPQWLAQSRLLRCPHGGDAHLTAGTHSGTHSHGHEASGG